MYNPNIQYYALKVEIYLSGQPPRLGRSPLREAWHHTPDHHQNETWIGINEQNY
jgi:hypothetical protein